jgi:hypothetical protein
LQQTLLVACWEVAKDRFAARSKLTAEAESTGLPRVRLKGDVKSLKRAYVDVHGRLDDACVPAAAYLEKLLNGIEDAEFEAESLKEVLAKSEEEEADLVPRFTPDGGIKMRTLKKVGKMPESTEEFRRKLEVMGHAWGIVALKHRNRAWLQTVHEKVFQQHANYVLGEHVAGLVSRNAAGAVIHSPPWALVLSYEQRIRAKAFQSMDEDDKDFALSFKEARSDIVVKERFFTTPLSQSLRPGHHNGVDPSKPAIDLRPNAASVGKTKSAIRREAMKNKIRDAGAKAKGKGADRLARSPKGVEGSSKTPDGQPICFARNSAAGCRNGAACRYVHCCSKCFSKDHGAHEKKC